MSFELVRKIFIDNWPMFLRGAYMTLLISSISTVLGSIIGLIIGIIHTIPLPEKGSKRIVLK